MQAWQAFFPLKAPRKKQYTNDFVNALSTSAEAFVLFSLLRKSLANEAYDTHKREERDKCHETDFE